MYGVLFDYKRESTGVFLGEGCNAHVFVPRWLSVCMQRFVTKLGIVVHDHKPECHAKKRRRDSIFKVKVIVWAYIIKI